MGGGWGGRRREGERQSEREGEWGERQKDKGGGGGELFADSVKKITRPIFI